MVSTGEWEPPSAASSRRGLLNNGETNAVQSASYAKEVVGNSVPEQNKYSNGVQPSVWVGVGGGY